MEDARKRDSDQSATPLVLLHRFACSDRVAIRLALDDGRPLAYSGISSYRAGELIGRWAWYKLPRPVYDLIDLSPNFNNRRSVGVAVSHPGPRFHFDRLGTPCELVQNPVDRSLLFANWC